MKFAVKAGDPYWDKHKAFGKALFLLINIQTQSQAPPAQPLVTSGVLWARAADPSGILITYVFIQKICQLALKRRPVYLTSNKMAGLKEQFGFFRNAES